MLLFLCCLARFRADFYSFVPVAAFFSRNRCMPDHVWKKESQRQSAFNALPMGCRLSVSDSLSFKASFSIEAAFIFSFILMILGGIMLLALERMQEVESIARSFRDALNQYDNGLRPADLIRIGAFIQEWIPPKP